MFLSRFVNFTDLVVLANKKFIFKIVQKILRIVVETRTRCQKTRTDLQNFFKNLSI